MPDSNISDLISEALKLKLEDLEDESSEKAQELQRLGNRDVFSACEELCKSTDNSKRILGADVLGQLGWDDGKHPFKEESLPILANILESNDEGELRAAIIALNHLGAEDILLQHSHLANHGSALVREALAFAYGGIDENISIEVLIRLSADEDGEVRDWATFGLGTQSDMDTEAIRQALLDRLDDNNGPARTEALMGLALRKVQEAIPALIKELNKIDPYELAIEAADEMASPELVPALTELAKQYKGDEQVLAALARCNKGKGTDQNISLKTEIE